MLLRIAMLLSAILGLCGCGQPLPSYMQKIYSQDITYGHRFDQEFRQLSFFSGEYPLKTFFNVYNFKTQEIQRLHFKNFSFVGHHVLLNREYALANAFFLLENENTQQRLLLMDIARSQIVDQKVFPNDFQVLRIAQPDWSDQVYVLFHDGSNILFYRTVDIRDNTLKLSDSVKIGHGNVGDVLFLDNQPILLISVQADLKNSVLIYHLNDQQVQKRLDLNHKNILWQEDETRQSVLFAYQQAGATNSTIRSVDTQTWALTGLFELSGEAESLLLADDSVYVIEKDAVRPPLGRKNWAHPRNLVIADLLPFVQLQTIDWTEHEGTLLGYDAVGRQLIYAVSDYDGLGLWALQNDEECLRAVKTDFP